MLNRDLLEHQRDLPIRLRKKKFHIIYIFSSAGVGVTDFQKCKNKLLRGVTTPARHILITSMS